MVMSAMVQIFPWGERWDVIFNEAKPIKFNRKFHLSPYGNICTITRMKNLHYLFYITSKNRLITFIYLKTPILFWSRRVRSKVTQVYIKRCTVLLHDTTARWRYMRSIVYIFYFISRDPLSSNQMTWIYIGVM